MKPGDIVFLSASVPYRQGWVEDARPAEIEEAVVSIARAVFARGGRLLFGGHPSISPLIAAVAGEYYEVDPRRDIRPVITFQSEFFRGRLPDKTWDLYKMGWSAIEWTPIDKDREDSLQLMREWMLMGPEAPRDVAERNGMTTPKVMIAVGGMEGVVDEADMFRRFCGRPVYAITSGGGAARRLADGPQRQVLSLEKAWRDQLKVEFPADPEFEPYAVMAQWLMDTL